MHTRYFDDYTIPEILIRRIDDIVLSLKSMNIRNISDFPFPSKPNYKQLCTSLSLLCNIGCITTFDDADHNNNQDDGAITLLGKQVSVLPLNVRLKY